MNLRSRPREKGKYGYDSTLTQGQSFNLALLQRVSWLVAAGSTSVLLFSHAGHVHPTYYWVCSMIACGISGLAARMQLVKKKKEGE